MPARMAPVLPLLQRRGLRFQEREAGNYAVDKYLGLIFVEEDAPMGDPCVPPGRAETVPGREKPVRNPNPTAPPQLGTLATRTPCFPRHGTLFPRLSHSASEVLADY